MMNLSRVLADFNGRTSGAIGICSRIQATIFVPHSGSAPTDEEVRLATYDSGYEWVANLRWQIAEWPGARRVSPSAPHARPAYVGLLDWFDDYTSLMLDEHGEPERIVTKRHNLDKAADDAAEHWGASLDIGVWGPFYSSEEAGLFACSCSVAKV